MRRLKKNRPENADFGSNPYPSPPPSHAIFRKMKLLWLALVCITAAHAPAHADDSDTILEKARYEKEHPELHKFEASLSADAYRSGLPGTSGVGVRPVLSFDLFVDPNNIRPVEPGPWNVGGSFSDYTISSTVKIERTDLTLHGGYWFFHHRLGVLAKLGSTTTTSNGFSSDSESHYGAEMKYQIPISERFNVVFNAGWTHFASATLTHDTGIPNTDNPLANAVCSIITFGIADNCGDQITTLTVPAANMVDIGAGIAFYF